jgi:hypothetical protein
VSTPTERRLRSQIGAHESWARTENRSARTLPARRALEAKWLKLAGGDPRRAESLRNAHYERMALKSAQVRRRRASMSKPARGPVGGAA